MHGKIVVSAQISLRTVIARNNGEGMTAQDRDRSTSEHVAKMIAKGEVRPGKGPRFLPQPIKTQPRGKKTAADWVAEGRR
jgi:hypothetical protein